MEEAPHVAQGGGAAREGEYASRKEIAGRVCMTSQRGSTSRRQVPGHSVTTPAWGDTAAEGTNGEDATEWPPGSGAGGSTSVAQSVDQRRGRRGGGKRKPTVVHRSESRLEKAAALMKLILPSEEGMRILATSFVASRDAWTRGFTYVMYKRNASVCW